MVSGADALRFAFNKIGYKRPSDISSAAYDASKGDLAEGLDALRKSGGGSSIEDLINNDPIFALEQQRIAGMPGGSGGGGSSISYSAPDIGAIERWGKTGSENIKNLYAQLGTYLQGQQADTQNRYNAATMTAAAGYNKAAEDIAAAQQQAGANLTAQAGLGLGGANAQAAAAEQQGTANAAIQRQAALNQTNRANTIGSMQNLGAGMAGAIGQFVAGAGQEGAAQGARFQSLIANKLSEARAQKAAAEEKARSQAAEQASKASGASIKALEDAVKRAQSQQDKEKKETPLSGMKGVLEFAARRGNIGAAKKFLDLLNSSSQNAANLNQIAKLDRAQGKQTPFTTADEQLQVMLSEAGPGGKGRFDLSDTGLDLYRGDFLKQVQDNPELSFLKRYLVSSPEEAKRQGQYQAAFGRSKEDYERGIKGGSGLANLASHIWGGITTGNPVNTIMAPKGGADFEREMGNRFTPFINIDALRASPSDVSKYYDYFNNYRQEQDLLTDLFRVYSGKYGKGNF